MKDMFDQLLANPTVHMVGLAILLAVVAMWLAAAWWTYQDASRRTESSVAGFAAASWIIISTPVLLPLSLAIYATARPQATASDDRTHGLMRQLTQIAADRPTCPSCAALVDPDWLRCPACATWFARECEMCGEWSAASLELCPYCGTDRDAMPAGVAAAVGRVTPVDQPAPAPRDVTTPTAPAAVGPATLGAASLGSAGHGTAAASKPAAAVRSAGAPRLQRGRMASSSRPFSYEASRASSSVSS